MRDGVPFWLIMLTHTLLAAGTYLFGKVATAHFSVVLLGFVRIAIATICFCVLASVHKLELLKTLRQDWRTFFSAAFLGILVNQIGFLWGLKLSVPSHAALIFALTPTLVLLLGWARGAERPGRAKMVGIALAFAGVATLFQGRHSDSLPATWLMGDLLLLCATAAWSTYTVLSRPLIVKHGSLRATGASVLAGTVVFLPLGAASVLDLHVSHIPPMAWFGALYLGVMASVVMYLLWFHALGIRESSRVAIWANGQPVLTAALAWMVLGQPVTLNFGIGAVLVITGVVMTQGVPRR